MSRLRQALVTPVEELELSLEGQAVLDTVQGEGQEYPVYILLTNTGTTFSKVSRLITKDPYNHVSLSFDPEFAELYTYNITNDHGMKGGLLKETRESLKGSRYSLYYLGLNEESYWKVKNRVEELEQQQDRTSYNHLALINAIFRKDIFVSNDKSKMICSQFVAEILRSSGVELFSNRDASTVRPYEFVRSKLLKFVRRGSIR